MNTAAQKQETNTATKKKENTKLKHGNRKRKL